MIPPPLRPRLQRRHQAWSLVNSTMKSCSCSSAVETFTFMSLSQVPHDFVGVRPVPPRTTNAADFVRPDIPRGRDGHSEQRELPQWFLTCHRDDRVSGGTHSCSFQQSGDCSPCTGRHTSSCLGRTRHPTGAVHRTRRVVVVVVVYLYLHSCCAAHRSRRYRLVLLKRIEHPTHRATYSAAPVRSWGLTDNTTSGELKR